MKTSHLVAALFAVFTLNSSLQAALITIDWVTVGDPGNAADTTTYGAVADSFRIMKFEFQNSQYAAFLNAVAKTDLYSLYDTRMGSNARGGITRSGLSGSYTYTVRTNMGDKPVNYVSWFDAARVANWLMNGATSSSSTETGAYTIPFGQINGLAPAVNSDATFYIPTENEWYKAAYYKGGGTNAGYWNYATQSNTAPTAVTASTNGIGSAGSTGNFANYDETASWNRQTGNVTTVGSNGGPSAYGLFDMSGNLGEWNDLTGATNTSLGTRGGHWSSDGSLGLSSAQRAQRPTGDASDALGFRLASVDVAPIPEPGTWAAMAIFAGGAAYAGWRRRRRA